MPIPIFYWIPLRFVFKAPRLNQQDFDSTSWFKFANRTTSALFWGANEGGSEAHSITVADLLGWFSAVCLPPGVSSSSQR